MENATKVIGLERAYIARQLKRYFKLFLKYSTPSKIVNLLKCEFELYTKKTRLSSMPYSVKLEPTNVCNLDCVFCDRKKVHYEEGFVAFDDFRKVFDQIKRNLYFCALELWGEPLLHKDICKIIRYIHDNNVATYVSTNLNYLTDEIAEGLMKTGLDLLTIAVDGATQETYSKYRKDGDFSKVVENLRTLVRKKREVGSSTQIELQFIVFRYNEHEVGKIKALAKNIGVDSLKLRPGLTDNDEWVPKNRKYRYDSKKVARKRTCWWLWRTVSISWNGLVFPCCRKVFDDSFGDMHEMDFRQIWNNKSYVDSRRCFSSNDKKDTPCYTCEIPFGNLHA